MRRLLLILPWLAAAAFAAPPASKGSASLCLPDEQVQFSCDTGTEQVSLCASAAAPRSLTYRRGAAGSSLLVLATDGRGKVRFGATTMPLQPGAQVQQVWIDADGLRHWMGVCVGGMCPQEAVVAVLQGPLVLRRQVCRYQPSGLAWFKADVVRFGQDVDDSRADDSLVELDHVFQPLEQLFIGHPVQQR